MGAPAGVSAGWRRWIPRDPYTIAAWLVFISIVVCCWVGFVDADEEIYLLGSRRLADPSLLATDLTWMKLSPTTALYDHLLAPLWSFLDAFAIVNLGRFAFWALMAWSLAQLAKAIRLPAWSLVVGFTFWLLWKQTLGTCGSPFQGFQPKSFAYPLVIMSLTSVLRGNAGRAGLAAGLATAFHIVVGGWACLAICLGLLVERSLFTFRQVAIYLGAAALFIAPLIIALFLFRTGHVAAGEQARMNEIYTLFAMPHCCDPSYFMASSHIPLAWLRSTLVFALSLLAVFAWPDRRVAVILGSFIAALIAFFGLGLMARQFGMYGLLTLYPFQLANALPALFLFVFAAAWLSAPGIARTRRWLVAAPLLAGTLWLGYDGDVARSLIDQPQSFINELQSLGIVSPTLTELDPLYAWIRANTPRNSVFITPMIYEFWPYAERAQVASMRQPPLDESIVEWERRLVDLNGRKPYVKRGFETEVELAQNERSLSIAELTQLRDHDGATHYLVQGERKDLTAHLLHAEQGYFIYDLTHMSASE